MSLTFEGDGTITGFDAGLSGFGGLVAVKHAIFTGTFSASVAAAAGTAVTDLSITHTLADASNKLILMAGFGMAMTSSNFARTGIAIADNGTKIGVGDAASNRTSIGAGGLNTTASNAAANSFPSTHLVYAPGDTSSHTYTVLAINTEDTTRTIYINRAVDDADTQNRQRGASVLTLMEVSV